MDTMNAIVAKNIRRLREENRLSMEELAKLSGVSKSMLAQIERGDGNPTISTLWKISNGMKVPFDALTVRPKAPYEIVKTSDIQPILEDGGKVRNYPVFPDDENRRFAVYYLELSSHSTARVISEETGAKQLLLHSCHNVTRREFDQGVTYLQLMRQNVENLRQGLD